MRKIWFIFVFLISGTILCVAEMPFNERLNRAESWRASSSGKMTAVNEKDGSLRFDVTFSAGVDRWVYPALILKQPQENLADAKILSFDIKASRIDSKLHFVMLDPGEVRIPYSLKASDEFQTVTIDLTAQNLDLSKLSVIKIGMNPTQDSLTYHIRNLRISGTPPAGAIPLPFSARLNRAESWRPSSSGTMTITDRAGQDGFQVDVDFPAKVDRWAYPALILKQPQENLEKASMLNFEIRTDRADSRHHFVMFEPGDIRVPYGVKPGDWQQVSIDLGKLKIDRKELRVIRIGMNPVYDRISFEIRRIEITGELAPLPPKSAAEIVETRGAVGSVFTDNQPLRFGLKEPRVCKWVVSNWRDDTVTRGVWPDQGAGELLLPALPCGYYMLSLESENGNIAGFRSFAVVSDPAKLKRNSDMFFAIDTAQSWIGRADSSNEAFPGEGFEVISDLVYLAGFSNIRERLSWGDVERKRGEIDWKQYDLNANLLQQRGVTVSGMFHDAPPWAKEYSPRLPDDLFALYEFCKKLSGHFKGRMANWEFWNEQDIAFAPEPVWDYAAAMKAAFLGFKAGDDELPVAVGALCVFPVRPYARAMMENHLAEYFDIFNYHTYHALDDYSILVTELQKILAENHVPEMPIYFTETGTNTEGGGRIRRVAGTKLHAHDPEQEMMVAEFAVKSQIVMQSLGVARNFFFVLSPYNEGDGTKDWGLMRRDYTVKPGYVALAAQIRQLGDAKYLGELAAPANVRAFLYETPDGKQAVAFWSKSELDAGTRFLQGALNDWKRVPFSLPVKGSYLVTDAFGSSRTVASQGGKLQLESTRFISYVSGVSGLNPAVPARKIGRPGALQSNKDKHIVFKTRLSDRFSVAVGKESVDFKSDDPAPFELEIYNFSDSEKRGSVQVQGAQVAGLPETVVLPPFGKTVLALTMTPPTQEEGKIIISGRFNDRQVSSLVMNVFRGEVALENGTRVPLVRTNDPESWRKNSSGNMQITYDAKEEAVRFDTVFPKGVDRWVYPEFVLQLPQESFAGAYGIEFEIKQSTTETPRSYLMLVPNTVREGGKSYNINYVPATNQWEKRMIFFENSEELANIKQFRLGMNPRSDKNTFFLRKINIVYRK